MEDFASLSSLSQALATRAAFYCTETNTLMQTNGLSLKQKMNERYLQEIIHMVRAHIQYVIFEMAREVLTKHKFADARINPLLELQLKIYAVKVLQDDTQGLYETGYFS